MKDLVPHVARQLAARHRQATGAPAFRAEVQGTRGALYLYDVIGQDWWTGEGITGKSVQEALDGMKGASALDVYVNSPGGDIFEAKAIYAQLRRFAGASAREVVVHIDGIAASAATFIAMAGDRIVTSPAATWMIHEVWARTSGRAADFRAMADTLDLENKVFAETYAKRTGSSLEDVQAWMAAETWMDAATAKARGFTDEIAEADASGSDAAVAALLNLASTLRGLAG